MSEKANGKIVRSPFVGGPVFVLDKTSDIMQQSSRINKISIQAQALFIRNDSRDSGNIQKVSQIMTAKTAVFFMNFDSLQIILVFRKIQ